MGRVDGVGRPGEGRGLAASDWRRAGSCQRSLSAAGESVVGGQAAPAVSTSADQRPPPQPSCQSFTHFLISIIIVAVLTSDMRSL